MAEKLASDRKLTLGKTGPLVENLQTVWTLIPRYNLTGDKDLDAFCARARELSTVAPETLKANQMVRGSVARRAQAIIDEMSDFMGGPSGSGSSSRVVNPELSSGRTGHNTKCSKRFY